MPANIFSTPREIYYGRGALESLRNIPGRRALIVTDPTVQKLGLASRVKTLLGEKGAETALFDQVEPDPSRETVWKIHALASDFEPDLFVGLGGGSSIDAGKGAWVLYENPELAELSVVEVMRRVPGCVLRRKARYTAIPTTSGTGSEATRVAVVTDRHMNPPFKAPWMAPQLVPDVAIVDPELTVSMPPDVTANTGFDALIHAIECIACTQPMDIIDSLALWSAKTICTWLPKAVSEGRDLEAREKMHMASLQAGIAFTNGRLGMVHGLAHIIGAEFGIPHGRANAFMLCPVFAFWYETRASRLGEVASALGIEGPDNRAKTRALLEYMDRLKETVGIPTAIKTSGLAEDRFIGQLDPMAGSWMEQLSRVPPEARKAAGLPESAEETKVLFMHAWNGTWADLI